jgi:hypothetical protein
MTGERIREILCGERHIPVESRIDVDAKKTVICSACGQTDSFEDAAREAAAQFADKVVRNVVAGLGSSMTVNSPPDREYRWLFGE